MRFHVLICTFVLTFCSYTRAATPITPPEDVPPVMATAVATSAGDDLKIKLMVPCARWKVVGEVVPKSQWPELQVDIVEDTRTLVFGGPSALAESRVLDVQGKDVSHEEILARLKEESPVLVSVSGKVADPYYLQLAKPETLVIVLGPRDKMPAPALLPSQAPKPTTVRYRPPAQEEQPRWRSVLKRGGSRLRGVLGVGEG
jgi:hypothetical protein